MKSKVQLILAMMFSFTFGTIKAQVSTVSGFNYYDINKNAFTVDASCFGGNAAETDEYNYRFTSIHLANKLQNVFYNSQDSLDLIVGDYKLIKRPLLNKKLGGEAFRYIMIRPNDNVVRPVILITHGGKTGGATPLRVLSLGVFDYVQRGYAVVYYQSGTATGDFEDALVDAGLTADCQEYSSADETMDCFQQAVYVKYQFAVAARDYTSGNSANLKIDESLIFASGFSGGALGTLYLALADTGNFNDTIFAGMGEANNLSRFPTENGEIKAVSTLAGGVIDPSSTDYKIGTLVDASDQNTRFLMFHGQDDDVVHPETKPLAWTNPAAELPGSQLTATISLDGVLAANNIESKSIINCSACHGIFTYPCEYNDDCFGNNPVFTTDLLNIPCLGWAHENNFNSINFTNLCATTNVFFWPEMAYVMDQIHDNSKISANFLHEDFANVGPTRVPDTFVDAVLADDAIFAVNPQDFPFDNNNGSTNGHYIASTKCLDQSCSALYFNELGNSDVFGSNYKGDYLTMTGIPNNTYNNDFTLELQMKAIDQSGMAALFSHINGFTLGFEILINGNGFVQFKRNHFGQKSTITGTVNVLDDACHIISLTRSGNQFALYVDGVLQGSKKTFQLLVPNGIAARIGNTLNQSKKNYGFNGIIRNITLWSTALSPGSLGQISIPTSTPNLTSEWQLNQGSGQAFSSTSGSYPIRLGNNENTHNFDPRWMKDDEICHCFGDAPKSLNTASILEENDFVIYPNPNNGEFTIEFSENEIYPNSVSFYTIDGGLVQASTIDGFTTNFKGFSKGIYLVEFSFSDHTETKKIIVQ